MACIAKRRDRWIIDFYDNHGKRRWKTLPKGTTKGKAREAMRDIEDQLAKGIYLPDRKVPLFNQVAKDWLKFKQPNLRASTWSVYEGHIRNHLSEFDILKVNRITLSKVEAFIASKQKSGVNIVTLKKVVTTLNQIMTYAVRHKYIDHNPVRDAEKPRGKGDIKAKTIRVLTPAQINSFLESVDNSKYRTLFMLAVMSGARQGELLGLKWSDVDWFNNQIQIQRTFNNGAWYEPKSTSAYRKIDLGPTMMTELKKWRLACPSNELDLVFPNETGNVIDDTTMLRTHFHPALKNANLPRIRFHDLRHTKASLMIEQGESIKYIQSQLGHASPSITLDVYAHLINSVNPEAARRLENLIFSTTGSKTVAK